jgi:hypothetical protein
MTLHSNGLPYHTIKRDPRGFAHAILLVQDDDEPYFTWEIIDLYGSTPVYGLLTDEDVKDWPVVYTPIGEEEWEKVVGT